MGYLDWVNIFALRLAPDIGPIDDFGIGTPSEAINAGDKSYPLLWLEATPFNSLPQNEAGATASNVSNWETAFYILDKGLEGSESYDQIGRTMLIDRCWGIAEACLAYLYAFTEATNATIGSHSITPLVDDFADRVTGVRVQLQLQLPDDWDGCALPLASFTPGPTPGGGGGNTFCPIVQACMAPTIEIIEGEIEALGQEVAELAEEIAQLGTRIFVSQLSVTVRPFAMPSRLAYVSWTSAYDALSGAVFSVYRWDGFSFLALGGFAADGRETEYALADFFLDPIPSGIEEYILTVTTLADPTEVRVSGIEWDFSLNNGVDENTADIAALDVRVTALENFNKPQHLHPVTLGYGTGTLLYATSAEHVNTSALFNLTNNTYYIIFRAGTWTEALNKITSVGLKRTTNINANLRYALYNVNQDLNNPATYFTLGSRIWQQTGVANFTQPGRMGVATPNVPTVHGTFYALAWRQSAVSTLHTATVVWDYPLIDTTTGTFLILQEPFANILDDFPVTPAPTATTMGQIPFLSFGLTT